MVGSELQIYQLANLLTFRFAESSRARVFSKGSTNFLSPPQEASPPRTTAQLTERAVKKKGKKKTVGINRRNSMLRHIPNGPKSRKMFVQT